MSECVFDVQPFLQCVQTEANSALQLECPGEVEVLARQPLPCPSCGVPKTSFTRWEGST